MSKPIDNSNCPNCRPFCIGFCDFTFLDFEKCCHSENDRIVIDFPYSIYNETFKNFAMPKLSHGLSYRLLPVYSLLRPRPLYHSRTPALFPPDPCMLFLNV